MRLFGTRSFSLSRRHLLGLLDKLLFHRESMSRGLHADFQGAERPFNYEERKSIWERIERAYDVFLDRVTTGRNLSRRGRVCCRRPGLDRAPGLGAGVPDGSKVIQEDRLQRLVESVRDFVAALAAKPSSQWAPSDVAAEIAAYELRPSDFLNKILAKDVSKKSR